MEHDPPSPFTVHVELTVKERHTALQLAQRHSADREGASRWIPLAIILAALAFLPIGQEAASPSWAPFFASGWTWIAVLLLAWFATVPVTSRLWLRLAAHLPSHVQLTADVEHLALTTNFASMQWPWFSIASCRVVGDTLEIAVRGLMVIAVPSRAFESAEALQKFVEHVRTQARSHGGAAASALDEQPASPSASERKTSRLLSDFARNVYAGLLLWFLRRDAINDIRPSSAQFALLVVADVALSLLLAWLQSEGQGYFNWFAIPETLFFVLTILAAASFAAWLAGRSEKILTLAVAIAALSFPASVLLQVTYGFLDPETTNWLWWAFIGWTSVASAVTAIRLLEAPAIRAAWIAPAVFVTLITPLLFQDFSNRLWMPDNQESAEESEQRARYERAGSEAVLYAQPRLLDEALGAIQPGTVGVIDLFFVGFAGSGYQDVFLNEVAGAERVLKERFALGPHSVILANSMRSTEERPFATGTALRRALGAIAQKMNRDEDILFLFLTAHGGRNHELDVSMFPFQFKSLSATDVRQMLDETGIRNRVIVVSACYSGGFIPAHEGPDALVITAAHADKTSFGCRDGAEWTYFGQAFFSEALAEADSFEDAFRIASERIIAREQSENLEASEPQISIGERINAPLQAFYQRVRRPKQ